MITSTQKIVAALAQVKVDHKEDLVVPFGIPWHSYYQPSYADHAATAIALFRRLVYMFTPSGPIASPYTPIVTWVFFYNFMIFLFFFSLSFFLLMTWVWKCNQYIIILILGFLRCIFSAAIYRLQCICYWLKEYGKVKMKTTKQMNVWLMK